MNDELTMKMILQTLMKDIFVLLKKQHEKEGKKITKIFKFRDVVYTISCEERKE